MRLPLFCCPVAVSGNADTRYRGAYALIAIRYILALIEIRNGAWRQGRLPSSNGRRRDGYPDIFLINTIKRQVQSTLSILIGSGVILSSRRCDTLRALPRAEWRLAGFSGTR
jgi:hypothetical protein